MPVLERRCLKALEPLVSAFWMMPPESTEAYAAVGITDPLAGYVTGRAAPLGWASAATVAAVFYNWDPRVIEASLRFDQADPAAVLGARERGLTALMARLLREEGGGVADVSRATELLRRAADACRPEGRPLFAGNAALPWSEDPLVALWQGANLLREYRGDGHNAILIAHGLDGPQALALNVAYTGWNRGFFYGLRGWPQETYQAAHEALVARGFLTAEAKMTDAGLKFREMLEVETDHAVAAPFEALGADGASELLRVVEPLGNLIIERKGVSGAVSRIGGA